MNRDQFKVNNIHFLISYMFTNKDQLAATMRVYRDFFTYGGGIYQHTRASRSEPTGFHSVRLVGWGEERGTKYWVSKNPYYCSTVVIMKIHHFLPSPTTDRRQFLGHLVG